MVTGETVFDERWAQIVGYRLEELEPVSIQTWTRLSHPDDLAASTALIEEHVKGLTPFYESEVRMQAPATAIGCGSMTGAGSSSGRPMAAPCG